MTEKCPECGQETQGVGGVSIGFGGAAPGGPLPPPKPLPFRFHCERCGSKWEKDAPMAQIDKG